jgi:glutaredoxin-related protein
VRRSDFGTTLLSSRAVRGIFAEMQSPEIIAYLKTYCGWSAGVRAVLAKYNLAYTEKDIIQNPAFRWEM